MPGISAREMKKGKISKVAAYRIQANKAMVDSAVRDDLEEGTYEFGRVMKHLGNGRILVQCEDKIQYQAVIRGVLRKRSVIPIAMDDIVILGKREWESRAVTVHLDVIGILGRKDAEHLCSSGRISDWMLAAGGMAAAVKAEEDDGFVFERPLGGEEGEEEICVDEI